MKPSNQDRPAFPSLRRRVTGKVELDCRPGPATVLTVEQEERLSHYLIEMSEIGFGLTREDIMHLAFLIAEKFNPEHPFRVSIGTL